MPSFGAPEPIGQAGFTSFAPATMQRLDLAKRTENDTMRNETVNIIDEIKQAISLLRRHL